MTWYEFWQALTAFIAVAAFVTGVQIWMMEDLMKKQKSREPEREDVVIKEGDRRSGMLYSRSVLRRLYHRHARNGAKLDVDDETGEMTLRVRLPVIETKGN